VKAYFAFIVPIAALAACSGAETEPEDPAASDTPAPVERAPAGPESDASEPTSPEEQAAAAGMMQDKIPSRFHGTYAANEEECAIRSHGRFTVSGDRIQFFESSAEVLRVRIDGEYAAVDAEETYADRTSRYVFYMALEGDDRLRYRYDENERMTCVRCP
jgi:hypothetical protein